MGMTEDLLKDYILSKYKSIREFTLETEMPYSTLDTILKRGVRNASIDNIIKICQALGISTDALVKGKIEPAPSEPQTIAAHLDTNDLTEAELEDVSDYIAYIRNRRKK